MFHKMITSLLLSSTLLLTSCATITKGSCQPIAITSTPKGATAWIDGEMIGETPLTTKLSCREDHTLRIERTGYAPYEAKLTRSFNKWVLGNMLLPAGVIGVAIDIGSGAVYKLSPGQIHAKLQKETSENMCDLAMETGDDCYLFVTSDPSPDWERIG